MLRLKKAIDKFLEYLLVLVFSVLVIDVLWQVFSRFILSDPSSFTDELARFLLIWLSVLGAAYVTGQRLHLSIDLISNKLNEKQLLIVDLLIQCFILVFVISVFLIGGTRLVYVTLYLEQTSAALGLPIGYVYAVIPLSGVIMIFYSLQFLIEDFEKLIHSKTKGEIV
jgi:TRAP-type C4-dicarboxylate transport system permease small subunit